MSKKETQSELPIGGQTAGNASAGGIPAQMPTGTFVAVPPQGAPPMTREEAELMAEFEQTSHIGMGHVEASDVKVPRAKLAQGTSQEGVAGQYWFDVLKEGQEIVVCFFLDMRKSRVKFKEKYIPTEKEHVLCRSDDGITPHPDFAATAPAQRCTECPDCQWINKRQLCGTVYNFLALRDDNIPFWISFRSKGAPAAKDFLTRAELEENRHKVSMLQMKIRLASKKETNDKGTFFVPLIEVIEKLSKRDALGQFKSYKRYSSIKFEVDAPEDGGAAPAGDKAAVDDKDSPFGE